MASRTDGTAYPADRPGSERHDTPHFAESSRKSWRAIPAARNTDHLAAALGRPAHITGITCLPTPPGARDPRCTYVLEVTAVRPPA